MAQTSAKPAPRRRFAPVPIETTFERYRKGTVPPPSPSPSPSPRRSKSPPRRLWTKPKEKRRFAPQLIESSRRSRRVGDIGPATKPTDKTDITPYHNHIYALKTRKKHRRVLSLARRESCDDETADHFFETLVRENEKRILEDALAVFPNSRARAGGAEHFAIREASDDDSSGSQSRNTTGPNLHRVARRSRRDSLTEDVGWALKEMQEHYEHLSKIRGASLISDTEISADADKAEQEETTVPVSGHIERISTLELDRMSMDSPPSDPIWTTTARNTTPDSPLNSMGEDHMPFITEEPFRLPGSSDGYRGIPAYARKLREVEGDMEDDDKDEILRQNIASAPKHGDPPCVPSVPEAKLISGPATPVIIDNEFRGRGPFAGYRNRDLFAERDLHRLRLRSPPMLGKDLVFVQCLSPKQTKLDPQHLWSISDYRNDSHRDATGKHGLWNGYCYSREKNEALAPIERPIMLATPFPPSSPCDPFALAFSATGRGAICTEPACMDGEVDGEAKSAAATMQPTPGLSSAGSVTMALRMDQHRSQQQLEQHAGSQGHHVLVGLDERLEEEKAASERNEKIAAEFTDSFVTQVYNYLSLGYPAMARAYDDELSKISRIPVVELERDDTNAMDGIGHATGHLSLDDIDDKTGDGKPRNSASHDDCPRWHALKLYIYEWARQHPDLDSISPLAWGMRERRGSWGV